GRQVRPSSLAQAAGRLASSGPRTAPTTYHLPLHVTTSRTASRPAGPGGAGRVTSCQDSDSGPSDGPTTGGWWLLQAATRSTIGTSQANRFIAFRFIAFRR